MTTTIAVVAAGSMGSGVGRLLAEHGARVPTLLDGRSDATVKRARDAGMIAATACEIAQSDFILSIVPPGRARQLAEQLAPALHASAKNPIYVECNAINPETAAAIGEIVRAAGAIFVDGAIIGGAPKPGAKGPTFYISGEEADRAMALGDYGLTLHQLDGGIGAASALKMAYGGITKGLTAVGSMMILAASRAGMAEALGRELARSQPALFPWFARQVPAMFPRAYRWVAEMEEVAAFANADPAASAVFRGAASFYARIADDREGANAEAGPLAEFFGH
jgi:3-hydroxyisobutyrate dehydrogenase-like beta-hydroxyacid dehydrogenase